MKSDVFLLHGDMLTGYGSGVTPCVAGLFAGRHACDGTPPFPLPPERRRPVALFPDGLLTPEPGESRAESALRLLLDRMPPPESLLPVYFALTLGASEQLLPEQPQWTAEYLMERTLRRFPWGRGRIYSGACASGNIALAAAAQAVGSGRAPAVLTVSAELVNEFVFSGFSSLNAMASGLCRPFDRGRDGLLLGDAAAVALLGTREFAERNGFTPLARFAGAGVTTDAFHVAAPDVFGRCMGRALRRAMNGRAPGDIGAVIAHGTGTTLNDVMEINAVREVFPDPLPVVSIKGGTGHLLAASGLVQLLCAEQLLRRGEIFPQTNLREPEPAIAGYVSALVQPLRVPRILSMNAGFGGLNAVISIEALS